MWKLWAFHLWHLWKMSSSFLKTLDQVTNCSTAGCDRYVCNSTSNYYINIYSIHVYTFGFIKIVNEIFWLMYLSNLRASYCPISQTLGVWFKGPFKQVQLYTWQFDTWPTDITEILKMQTFGNLFQETSIFKVFSETKWILITICSNHVQNDVISEEKCPTLFHVF